MSREIEFQAWNKRLGKMMEWYGVLNSFADKINNPNFVLRQFTGLRDKNGIKIFEGDVVGVKYTGNFIGVIEYHAPSYWIKSISSRKHWVIPPEHALEVIDNVYANPELMGVGE